MFGGKSTEKIKYLGFYALWMDARRINFSSINWIKTSNGQLNIKICSYLYKKSIA
jgi:hypothetical protein